MNNFWNIVWTGFAFLIVMGFFGWLIWRALKRSDDPGRLIWKLGITAFLLGVLITVVFPMIGKFNIASAAAVPYLAAIGVILGLMWAPSWASMLFGTLTDAMDGGAADGEKTPQYSVAESKKARGHFGMAVNELRKELEKFPTDLRLQLMLAETYAENLNDLQGAESIILRICQQKHSPANIASALQKLADWHLNLGKDPDSARQVLERIINTFPASQFAQGAAQRIAHLTSVDHLLAKSDLPMLKLKEYEKDIGLKVRGAKQEEGSVDAHRAEELVRHLEQHPLDNNAREELARIYAEYYKRVDMAVDQLEELIARPNQKARDVVHWLELSADLYIKFANDVGSAESALRRIIEMFPNSAGAEMAQRRLATLNQELSINKKSQAIKLGSYEKDIGLKTKKPTGPPRAE